MTVADYIVAASHNCIEPYTTTPNQIDTITFVDNVDRVSVTSNGTAEVRVTNGGTDPLFGTPGQSTLSFRLPAFPSVRELPMPKGVDVLKIVSTGAVLVSVEVVR